jgi:hypothetical protein
MELNSILLDEQKLERGVWWSVHRNADGSLGGEPLPGKPEPDAPALLIVTMGLAYERAHDKAREPFLAKLREGLLTDAERMQINATALASAVLRGWQKLTLGGEPIEWSEEKAVELMARPVWASLTDYVMSAGRWRAAAAAREEEKAAGN